MIRSLHLIGSRSSGGAERFYVRLLTALHQAGESVHGLHPPGSEVDRALPRDIARRVLSMRGSWDLPAAFHIRRTALSLGVEIVQSYLGRATRLCRFPRKGAPVHVARLGGYFDVKGYRHAHAWVGNTRGICDYLIRQGVPADKVFQIGNFVAEAKTMDAVQLHAWRERHRIAADALVVLAVGRLRPAKGMETLLEAFNRLPPTVHGRPLHLVIVGDGPLRHALQQRVVERGPTERVLFTGWQDDPAIWFESCDLVVLPSRVETFGNVILEAWAHHRPVISTATAGGTELIRNGIDGLLVPIDNDLRLALTMLSLLEDSHGRSDLADRGLERLRANFSQQTVVDAYRDMYRRLLGSN